MKAIHRPGLAALFNDWTDAADQAMLEAPQGAFEIVSNTIGQREFWFKCPGACKSITRIAIRPVVNGSPQSWEWDGNEQAPTLKPSINHVGCWHGWLTAGEFIA